MRFTPLMCLNCESNRSALTEIERGHVCVGGAVGDVAPDVAGEGEVGRHPRGEALALERPHEALRGKQQ